MSDHMNSIMFFDTEVSPESKTPFDFGAVSDKNLMLHTGNRARFLSFVADARYLCGHNIFAHDLVYIGQALVESGGPHRYIDSLLLSPLLFPQQQHHYLGKDEKLNEDEDNNPLNDAIKARDLFYEEVSAFHALPAIIQRIYCGLLGNNEQYQAFFEYLDFSFSGDVEAEILSAFTGKICTNTDLDSLIQSYPAELAYCLALIQTDDVHCDLCPWLTENYPDIRLVMQFLRNIKCKEGCPYCSKKLNIHAALNDYFGYPEFRTYEGEALQESAVQSAVDGNSLLAVFPTGGGKSLTFQLPALMAGESVRGLTVVITPLQSLMKDQVDNLEKKGITSSVTINGLLDPIERADAYRRIRNCTVSILYISPESLRSRTIVKLLMGRNIVRFVVDEAHCFSAWGQDFRVDYQYIGEFIRKLKEEKKLDSPIPVSCFTATAKQKVISDIREYFRRTAGVELGLYTTSATRKNLRYEVLFRETDDQKYAALRDLVEAKKCPTIVYVARTKRAAELAEKLTRDGFHALPFHGKMENAHKVENMNAFMSGDVNIIVATSAFGMGVDKDNVGLVVHYNISNSLEDYVQEAGRAGRNPELNAECYVLFNDEDLDKHFTMLSQTKLSMDEIQQVWGAVKRLSNNRPLLTRTAYEIAREAGWNESDPNNNIQTKVKTAIAALENAGYITRGDNVPRIYANGILPHSMIEASVLIQDAPNMTAPEKDLASRAMTHLFTNKSAARAGNGSGINYVDELADTIGAERRNLVNVIQKLREIDVLADSKDLTAHIDQSDKQTRSELVLSKTASLERYLIENIPEDGIVSYKELNNAALQSGISNATVKSVKNILNYWQTLEYIEISPRGGQQFKFTRKFNPSEMLVSFEHRLDIARFIIAQLYSLVTETTNSVAVNFSVKELLDLYNDQAQNSLIAQEFLASSNDIEGALLYLKRIRAMDLDGGFLVFYHAMQIKRLEMNNHIQYKKNDYRQLELYYQQRIQQIHIVGRYAHLMTESYEKAQEFVRDYFNMDYTEFIKKYFAESDPIGIPLTPEKSEELFGMLSQKQMEIIQDKESRCIVVAAGPGSGKTMLLVHKLASLLLLENVKSEQLLMLTFSRAAASEFKHRLINLIHEAAYFVEINTFHSYSFDLLGRIGTLEESSDVVRKAAELIRQGDVDPGRITKTVLVIDEAQDMDEDEYALVTAIIEANPDIRVIAVGDDDQNIYQFKGADSKYFRELMNLEGSRSYELIENYRSTPAVVALANRFVTSIKVRMKETGIKAVKKDEGQCVITEFQTDNLETATVQMIRATHHDGSCCVLTAKNEEAFRIVAELKMQGYRARLIQDLSGFNLMNLLEIRSFLQYLGTQEEAPVITDEQWDSAIEQLKTEYSSSSCLPECLKLLNEFAELNNKKFRSDLEQYIYETKYEDLITDPEKTILVSTLHKAKGREFDTVYINLNHFNIMGDEQRRVLYVGMTRAKKQLFINDNSHLFDYLNAEGTLHRKDLNEYGESNEILLSLTHEDVYLDYFLDKQERIQKLRSGTELFMDGKRMLVSYGKYYNPVLYLSKKFYEKLLALVEAGYQVTHAEVRFIVHWQPKKHPGKQGLIILPDIYLKK